MNLKQAFRLSRRDRLALVGAGGKTTALFQLARAYDPPVVVTASTHLGDWQASFADRHLIVTRPDDVLNSAGQIEGITLLTGEPDGNQRLQGLDAETLAAVRELADQLNFPLLIEADGSRQRPIKAPAENEPAIPGWVNGVIVVAGLSGLGQALGEAVAHRPERFAELSGLALQEPVSALGLAQVLTHPEGGLKNVPVGARAIALLNQADSAALAEEGMQIAQRILGPFDAVVLAALEQKKILSVLEPTGAVILAAGGSQRYGEPKLLLPWRGKALVRHAVEAALDAGLWPVIVVVGAHSRRVQEVVEDLPVTCIDNNLWEQGQSTSLLRGLSGLPKNAGSVIFLLGDQPAVRADLLRRMKERHYATLAPVIAPRVNGQRTPPTLFDRATFEMLAGIEGDQGGRAILNAYAIDYLDWEDAALLLDVDTPEDYQKLRGVE